MTTPMMTTDKTPGPDTPAKVADVVRHTDSGAGASQAEHWPATEVLPDATQADEVKPDAPHRPFKDVGSI